MAHNMVLHHCDIRGSPPRYAESEMFLQQRRRGISITSRASGTAPAAGDHDSFGMADTDALLLAAGGGAVL